MKTPYPVRCCCQPQKILGWLELPEGLPSGYEITMATVPPLRLADFPCASAVDPAAMPAINFEKIRLRSYGRPGQWEIAVYSDDRPIEFWRKVPGFIEARHG